MLLAKKDMDSCNLESLTKEQKEKLISIKNGLELNNTGIYEFGTNISQKLGEFSSELLSQVKVNSVPEIEVLMAELMDNIDEIDVDRLSSKKRGFFSRFFKVNEIESFIRKHDGIVPVVEATKNKLERCQYQLKKDIETCALYYQENIDNINELDYHIVAGRMKLNEAKAEYDKKMAELDSEDMLAVQELSAAQGVIDLLDRKIYNLELLRNLAIQNIPKLKILADSDNATIDKISTSITMTIPIWESQMLMAILIARAKTATDLDKAVTDMTNKLIENNSSYLRLTATQIETQIERGVIDVESLKKSSEDIINTCKDVSSIREAASKNRELAIGELRQIQSNLASTLVNLESN